MESNIVVAEDGFVVEHVIVPADMLEYGDENWGLSDAAFWDWLYHHFD